jgi:hypothetical protein
MDMEVCVRLKEVEKAISQQLFQTLNRQTWEELLTICLTVSAGEVRSMSLLWIRSSNLSQVFEPSPQGVFPVMF